MSWLIIIGVLIIAIGPIFYLLPSAKDKRLSKLRLHARQEGLTVAISFVPKLDPEAADRVSAGGAVREAKEACAAYHLALAKRVDLRAFLLQRLPENPTVPVHELFPGWGMRDRAALDALRNIESALKDAAAALPDDTLAIGFDVRSTACFWGERAEETDGTVEEIKRALVGLNEEIVAAYARSSSGDLDAEDSSSLDTSGRERL